MFLKKLDNKALKMKVSVLKIRLFANLAKKTKSASFLTIAKKYLNKIHLTFKICKQNFKWPINKLLTDKFFFKKKRKSTRKK